MRPLTPTLLIIAATFGIVFLSCKASPEALSPPKTADKDKAAVLVELRTSQTREEWVSRYLKHYPETNSLAIIGDYNSDWDFTKRWQPFSISQMQTLVDTCTRQP